MVDYLLCQEYLVYLIWTIRLF